MDIQSAILLFFSSLHNNITVAIADVITAFGTELLIIAILLFVYYSIDKRKGATSSLLFLTSTISMGIIKAIVKFPRPWKVVDGLDSQSMEGATGYSFPSGHTTSAASAYSSIAVGFRKKWLSIICSVLIALVGLSRMFLCVHWPLDVVGGLLLGCGFTFVLYKSIYHMFEDSKKYTPVLLIVGIVTSVAALALAVLLCFELIDSTAYSDMTKNLASCGGICLGLLLEIRNYDFMVEEGHWVRKIIRFVLALLGVIIILPVSKIFLKQYGLYNPYFAQLRYFITCFWVTVFPLMFRKLFPKQYK